MRRRVSLHEEVADARSIDDLCKIRNYLSHGSRQAKSTLERVYQDKHQINRFVEPGKFLFAIDRQHGQGRLTRLQVYLDAFSNAAKSMQDFLLAPGGGDFGLAP